MLATLNGIQIAYTDEGAGQPLLFIHGFPLNRRAWAQQLEAFKSTYRVIVPDLRGFGDSGASAGPVSMDRFADDIWALAQHLGLGPTIVAGHSMGGYVALALARTYPAMLRGLALVGTKAGRDSVEAAKARRLMAEQVRRGGISGVLEAMATKMLSGSGLNGPKAASVRACMAPANPEGLVSALLGMALRPDAQGGLGQIRVPTLVLAGAEDSLIPSSESVALAKAIPDSQLRILPGAGHLVALDQGEAFNQALEEWLAFGCKGKRRDSLPGPGPRRLLVPSSRVPSGPSPSRS